MQSLQQALQDHDMGFFRILGELWGIDAAARKPDQTIQFIISYILDPERVTEIVEALPPESQIALARLLKEGVGLASGDFFQRYGPIRSMGPGRRDREKPWRSPVSTSERLYYHGLVARAFADSPSGPKEFIFIPDDLRPLLTEVLDSPEIQVHSVESMDPPEHIRQASSAILDDATTLLAASRRQPLSTDQISDLRPFLVHPAALEMLIQILLDVGVLSAGPIQPNPDQVARLLASPRNEALAGLCLAWRTSDVWNDFWLLNHLEPASGDWTLDPESVRAGALARFTDIPLGHWQNLDEFVNQVKRDYPTFARPGGDFEGWYLRDRRTGNFLRGFEAWEAVDGALLKAMVTGPLHWLGVADMGIESAASPHPTHFRLTQWATVLLNRGELPEVPQPLAKADVMADGRLILPRAIPRQLRYQVARLCSWQAFREDKYHYRLLPSAILAASEQGLKETHIDRLLDELSDDPIPHSLTTALQRLMQKGNEALLEESTLLRVDNSQVLDILLKDKRTSRLIVERLNATTAVITKASINLLIEAAARMGLLIEPPN